VALDSAGGSTGDASGDGGALTAEQTRGQYLVKSVLGCAGCHTPSLPGGGGADNSRFLGGNDCFTKDPTTGACLASANLTNDETGLKNLTDQQIKDAFTKGIDPEQPDGGLQYLFAQMPYYQFASLTDSDAQAIVAYLRTVAGVSHEHPANGGPFATQPTAPQWLPVALADLPSAAIDAGTGAGNGKYLSGLMCATCHTVNTSSKSPLQLNAARAFLGGKEFTTSVTVVVDGGASDGGGDGGSTATLSKTIQSTNLTSDPTGLQGWTVQQIVTAIKAGKDEAGRTICSPMRPFPGLADQDATDIATYLKAIPPVANALTETCE
jgi:mono/diheme cytochrome c family protein